MLRAEDNKFLTESGAGTRVTKRAPPAVSTPVTAAPALRSSRVSSSAL